MSDSNKNSKEIKKVEGKPKKTGGASAHTTPGNPKRRFDEVANSSAEELVLLSQQMEELSSEMKGIKDGVSKMMTRDDMKLFIKNTVEEIMNEINKGIDLQIETKIREHSNSLNKSIENLKKENELLRLENKTLQSKVKEAQTQSNTAEKLSKVAVKMANYNEQYSRKNNIKILNIKEKNEETVASLTTEVCKLFGEHGAVDLNPREIQAIHRIPGRPGTPKPVLIKLFNNNSKTKLMKVRSAMKSTGHRLIDDVTKMNAKLISELLENDLIDSAWYFYGSVYGKTTNGKRLKFDLYDDIAAVVTKPPPTTTSTK